MSIRQSFICPYCFETSQMRELQFRCFNEGCEKVTDPQMISYLTFGINNIDWQGNTIINANFTDNKSIPKSAKCPKCKLDTYTYVCPKCHNAIPKSTLEGRDFVFSIVGARATGKSHVIAVLINELIQKVFPSFQISMSAFDDTSARYQKEYYDRLFEAKQTLLQTEKSAVALQRGEGKPLIYTLKFSSSPLDVFKRRLTNVPDSITLAFYDVAGEDLANATDIYGKKNIAQSSGLIFLVDPTKMSEISRHLDKNTIERASGGVDSSTAGMVTLNVLENVSTFIHRVKGNDKQINIPTAVVLSKSDLLLNIPTINKDSIMFQPSPHRKVGKFVVSDSKQLDAEVKGMLDNLGANSFLTAVNNSYKKTRFFAMSALGNGNNPNDNGDINTPTPCRIEDSLLWLLAENGFIPKQN